MAQPLAADAPATPTGLETEPGNGQVTLTWEDPGDPTIKYIYRVQEGGGVVGSWKDIPGSDILGSNAGTISYVVPDLTNGSAYRFHLRAENDDGQSGIASSLWEYAISDAPAPTGFTVTVGWVSGEATLTWDDPGDNDITGYEYSAVAPGYNSGWTDIPNGANTFSVTLTGLKDEDSHAFRVRAVNDDGPGASSDPIVWGIPSPPRPPGPTGFSAIPGDGQVALSWDYSDDPRITGYGYGQIAGNTWIYYAIEGSDPGPPATP